KVLLEDGYIRALTLPADFSEAPTPNYLFGFGFCHNPPLGRIYVSGEGAMFTSQTYGRDPLPECSMGDGGPTPLFPVVPGSAERQRTFPPQQHPLARGSEGLSGRTLAEHQE